MTNTQESDPIAEKSEVVKTGAKSNRWNWKTVIAVTLTAAVKAISLRSAILQPVRQRLNQWNWRQKTALVTALAITAGSTFYHHRAHAAAIAWPAVIASAGTKEFLVKLFVSIGVSRAVNSALDKKIKKTAYAQTDGWLYSKRRYYQRDYSYDGSTTTTTGRVSAQAEAAQNKTYDTSGTHSRWNPSDMDPDEVLDYVSDNTNLRRGQTEEYQILNDGEPLYQWDIRFGNSESARTLETIGYFWGGYVQKLTAEEIQEDLDYIRDQWNAAFQTGSAPNRRPARLLGRLTLGPIVERTVKSFTCDKKIKLWSEFGFTRVPGDTTAGPSELQQPGSRPNYVTSFSYIAREAGYDGRIVTRIPENEEERINYPEPKSWEDHNFMGFDLTHIPWRNFKIIGTPIWTGEATRFFKHKKRSWCLTCGKTPSRRVAARRGRRSSACIRTTKHEYPVYQNENVKKPSN